MSPKTAKQLAQLIQTACILEACAPKPGNVNRCHDFPDTSLEDFLLSALAIGTAFENADKCGVGRIILDAITDTRRCVRSNTNLGMVLLLAPLVKACLNITAPDDLRASLRAILNSLTVEDARLAYLAIRQARPGGMGKVSQSDIEEEPSVTLLQAMALAQDRDSIAHEYVTGFAITFDVGLPAMKDALSNEKNFSEAIVQTFLAILSKVPDTLIARKKGIEAAQLASKLAGKALAQGGVFTHEGQGALAAMDHALRDKEHRLNPGTTADLTAAAVFLALLEMDSGAGSNNFTQSSSITAI